MATITPPRWDAPAWQKEWRVSTVPSAPSSILPLVSAVMESTAGRGGTTRRSNGVSTVVNVLQIIQHSKAITGSELCDAPARGERGLEQVPPLIEECVLPITPLTNGNSLVQQRRLIVVLRDMSLCGPDALHLSESSPSTLFHTSSRVILQTELADRVGWWSSSVTSKKSSDIKERGSSSSLGPKSDNDSNQRLSSELNPLGSLVVRTSRPSNPSKSGILECSYVPDVAWLRHGDEKGFAWYSEDNSTLSHAIVADDAIAVGFDASQEGNIKSSVCKQRLVSVFHTCAILASKYHSTSSTWEEEEAPHRPKKTTLIVDVGHNNSEGCNKNWSLLQQCALDAAAEVAVLLEGRIIVNVHPLHHRSAAKRSSVSPPPLQQAVQQTAVRSEQLPQLTTAAVTTAEPRSSVSVPPPPQRLSVGVTADKAQVAVRQINSSTVGEKFRVAAPVNAVVGTAVATVSPPTAIVDDDDEDVPLWRKYQDHSLAERLHGGKRLLCSKSDAQPHLNRDTDRGPFSHGPTEAIFIEVSADAKSSLLSSMLGASSILRHIFVQWYQPMLQRWQPPAPPGPLRVVIFLCHNETMISELLLSFADAAHDDNIYVPYLFAIGGQSQNCARSLSRSDDDMKSLGSQGDMKSHDGTSTTDAQRLQQMVAYAHERLPRLARDKSILVTCTDGLRDSNELQREWKKSRTLHLPQLWRESGGDTVEVFAPLLALIEKNIVKQSAAGTTTSLSAAGALASLGSEQVDRIRRRVAIATAPVFPRVLHQLFAKPRRPEVAVDLDREGAMFVGVVRPPSHLATARSGGGHHTMAPHSVRVTKDERATVLDAIRVVFSQEYRAAMDVLQTHRLREAKKHNGRYIPYLAGFCPLFVGARRIRISSVVRKNVFTEVELNLQDVQQRLRGLVDECRACVGDTTAASAALERVALHLLPQAKCNCLPRIGEPEPRVLPGARRNMKLCRHIVQVVCHFLDEYTHVESVPPPPSAPPPAKGTVAVRSTSGTAPPPAIAAPGDGKKRGRLVLAAANATAHTGGEAAAKQHRTEQPRAPKRDIPQQDSVVAQAASSGQPSAETEPIDFMKALRYVPPEKQVGPSRET